MGKFFFGIKPYANDNGTSHAAEFTDVSRDVLFSGFGAIKQHLDNNDYDVGIVRHSAFNLILNNKAGLYSKPNEPYSIFLHKRNNSIMRVEWTGQAYPKPLGTAPPLTFKPHDKIVIGDFLLNDDALKGRAVTNEINFKCLSMSSLFNGVGTDSAGLAAGDLYSEVIFKILNQKYVTDILTVKQTDIVCATDAQIDDETATDLTNKTGTEVLSKILKWANSVLRIESSTVFVSNRAETSDLKHTFYGPGTIRGAENVIDINNFRSGAHRVKNYITLKDSTKISQDTGSQDIHGKKKDELEFSAVTDGAKQQTALDNYKNEFRNAKIELNVDAPLNYETIALRRKDKVVFDFPVRFLIQNGLLLPYYGVAVYDTVDRYPGEIADIEIPAGTEFKINQIGLNGPDEMLTFQVRQVGT